MEYLIADIFSELGLRLSRFGEDARSEEIIRRASEANPWFRPKEIKEAAKSIAEQMLETGSLREWLSRYPALPVAEPREILIVMAGNIPFVGFQDLLCVLSAGHRAIVKLSSKDEVLISFIISELLDIEPALPVSLYTGTETLTAVIAMGGNNAVRIFRERYSGIPTLLRGSRSSLAVLDGTENREQLAGLAEDALLYSGLGCRNVSLIFVPTGYDFALLKTTLLPHHEKINPKFRNNYLQTKALLQMNNLPFIDCGVCLMCEDFKFSTAISCMNYAFYSDLSVVSDWVNEHDKEVQCVVGNIIHPRAISFGQTQNPELTDYPDGVDTMEFLSLI